MAALVPLAALLVVGGMVLHAFLDAHSKAKR